MHWKWKRNIIIIFWEAKRDTCAILFNTAKSTSVIKISRDRELLIKQVDREKGYFQVKRGIGRYEHCAFALMLMHAALVIIIVIYWISIRGLRVRSIKSFSRSAVLVFVFRSRSLLLSIFFLLITRFMFEFLSISPVSVYSSGSPCKQACNTDSRFFCICSTKARELYRVLQKHWFAGWTIWRG